jgi:isopentenyl-diphosphate delta-isomerase
MNKNMNHMKELLILVDEHDNRLGAMEKLPVHEQGLLHRAFSVFIFNSAGYLLLQQRSAVKYHSALLWSNTCCSHPRDGEQIMHAATRRLKEEMNLECDLEFRFSFIYKTLFENGLTENELDHVFFGFSDQLPMPPEDEVHDWKYISMDELETDVVRNPHRYSYWLKQCMPELLHHFNKSFVNTTGRHLVA